MLRVWGYNTFTWTDLQSDLKIEKIYLNKFLLKRYLLNIFVLNGRPTNSSRDNYGSRIIAAGLPKPTPQQVGLPVLWHQWDNEIHWLKSIYCASKRSLFQRLIFNLCCTACLPAYLISALLILLREPPFRAEVLEQRSLYLRSVKHRNSKSRWSYMPEWRQAYLYVLPSTIQEN